MAAGMVPMRASAFVLAAILIAGCSSPSAPEHATNTNAPTTTIAPCPSETLRRAAYADAEAFLKDDILQTAFTMRMEGTMQGKVGTNIFALDPAAKAVRISAAENDVRVAGTYYSVSSGETKIYGRNHQPGAQYQQVFDLMQNSVKNPEPDFFDDLTVEDYAATCIEQGGVAAIEYRYEKGGRKDVNVAESGGRHRPLSGETVDAALQDNYRASMSYATPTIVVDSTLPKIPLMVKMDPIVYTQNERGGISMIAELKPGTAWAPFGEIQTQLVGSDGTIVAARPLQAGIWNMDDGDLFEYQDKDSNSMLSTGDRFSMDLGPDLDIGFFDTWAGASANLQAIT